MKVIYLSIYLPSYLSIYLPAYLSIYLSKTLYMELSVSLCSCLAVCAVNVHYRGSEIPVREPEFRKKSGPPRKFVC